MNCSYCNSEVKEGMKFCPSCGREININVICPICGKEVKNGLKFCSNCGNKISNQNEVNKSSVEIITENKDQKSQIAERTVADSKEVFISLSELLNKQASDIDKGMDADELYCLACDRNNVQDFLGARKLFEKAAFLGHKEAMNWLGVYYDNGKGVAVNKRKAVSFYKLAADLDEPYAQNNLALCYLNGICVDKNGDLAFSLFKKAADNGCIDAICNLGFCYESGIGCKIDKEKALYYYKQSADKGCDQGKINYHNLMNASDATDSGSFNDASSIIPIIAKCSIIVLMAYSVLSTIGLYIGTYSPSFAFWPLITLLVGIFIHKKIQSLGINSIMTHLNKTLLIVFIGVTLIGGIKHQFWGSSDSTMVKTGQEAVLNVLKSPSTAKFISYGKSSKVKPIIEEHLGIKTKDNRDVMLFEVEAQNSFGGMVKSTFFVFYIDGKPIDVVEENSILSPNKSNVIAALNYNGWIGE